jgi:DNA-binding transcriptional ArsR family regulator
MAERPRPTPTEMVITDVEQLKVIGDPFRLQMVEVLAADPGRTWTAKELAARLEVKQTKLYHHLALLEEHRFIEVAETRMVSGILEKRYRASAHGFRVDHALITGGGAQAAISATLDAMFTKARHEILTAMAAGLIPAADREDPKRPRMGLSATHVRLSPAGVRKVMRMVEKLADIDAEEDPDGQEYGLLVGFYPRAGKD